MSVSTPSSATPAPRHSGEGAARRTRLSPERESELYAAVLDLVREVGYESLTLDAVAARSRCSKATLYRRWHGKPRLVSAALRHLRPFSLEDLDTGSLRGDVHELARRIGDTKKDIDLMRGITHAVHKDAELAEAMRAALIEPELEVMQAMLDRAVARGEVDAACPAIPYFPHALSGAVFARPMIEQRPADAAYLTGYLDAVVLPALLRA
ncbi:MULTISPECIES: TetR/AcrR family transcriptional regulator [Streptomyces]|uniref:TetR/AcrR family transcriptional regulator n=1 Tax=Streptomyces olivaceiscleroticus TaxID=68245 RepID=A0ABP3JRA0_9ACTN|nr:TetR/AcrR family transcriptional regulator [Streptomyces niger]